MTLFGYSFSFVTLASASPNGTMTNLLVINSVLLMVDSIFSTLFCIFSNLKKLQEENTTSIRRDFPEIKIIAVIAIIISVFIFFLSIFIIVFSFFNIVSDRDTLFYGCCVFCCLFLFIIFIVLEILRRKYY